MPTRPPPLECGARSAEVFPRTRMIYGREWRGQRGGVDKRACRWVYGLWVGGGWRWVEVGARLESRVSVRGREMV